MMSQIQHWVYGAVQMELWAYALSAKKQRRYRQPEIECGRAIWPWKCRAFYCGLSGRLCLRVCGACGVPAMRSDWAFALGPKLLNPIVEPSLRGSAASMACLHALPYFQLYIELRCPSSQHSYSYTFIQFRFIHSEAFPYFTLRSLLISILSLSLVCSFMEY